MVTRKIIFSGDIPDIRKSRWDVDGDCSSIEVYFLEGLFHCGDTRVYGLMVVRKRMYSEVENDIVSVPDTVSVHITTLD